MRWHLAKSDDAPLLARMNCELMVDEGHANPLPAGQLEARMRSWLAGEYSAAIFEQQSEAVAYALFRTDEGGGIFLRQFFVVRHRRREGIGRRAFTLFADEIVPNGSVVTLEVLAQNAAAMSFWQALGFVDYARTLRRLPEANLEGSSAI